MAGAARGRKGAAPAAGGNGGPRALVFALGAQTMVLELSLPRLLAPAFGNTLYGWTAAIGLVLAALAAGYQAGGALSSRPPEKARRLLAGLAAAASAWVALAGFLGDDLVAALGGLGLAAGPLAGTLLLAVPPAGLGAAVLPLAVALDSGPAGSGRSAGRLYAFSTVGSVAGVLATGYALLPFLGVAGSLYAAAGLGFAGLLLARARLPGAAGLGAVTALALAAAGHRPAHVLLDRSNGYHRLRVVEDADNPSVRRLYLDSTLEGAVLLGSDNPGIPYQRQGVQVAGAVPRLRRALFLGGGSFSMPRFLQAQFPEAEVEAAEIDPDVVAAARDLLELPPGLRVRVGDGRRVLRTSAGGYDLIVSDAFHGVRNIPFHLVTAEFHALAAEKLAPGGLYAVNVMGRPAGSRLVASVTRTLRETFAHVNHFGPGGAEAQNVWILASRQPVSLGDPAPDPPPGTRVLTDDRAPVEFLVALDLAREGGAGR